jgi:hypothetical protein
MDFEKRLEQAIDRGERHRDARAQAELQKTLSEEEFRNLHSSLRLNLTEQIESSLRKLSDHFPGFRFETVVEENGWGAKISRDDLAFGRRTGRSSEFSLLQILVRPFSAKAKIVEIVGKGTIRNKEVLTRSHFQFLTEANEQGLIDVLELWLLEFAEKFASTK